MRFSAPGRRLHWRRRGVSERPRATSSHGRSHGRSRRSSRHLMRDTAAVLTTLSLTLASCAPAHHGDAIAPAGHAPRTVTYLEPLFFNTLYPPAAGFYPNGAVVNNITDRLLYQDPETLELSPWIATSLPQVNADATEYTFQLRDDVTYSDGTPLTAANVVANFDLFAKGDKKRKLTSSEQISHYAGGEVLGPHTVRFHFHAPAPGFAQATSSFNAGLLSDATLARGTEGFAPGNATQIIGSGPFIITEEQQGSRLVLSARTDYHWGPPAHPHHGRADIDEVRYVLAGEESVRVGGLVSGQADIARQIEAPEEALVRKRGLTILAHGTNGMNNQLALRFRHPLLSDERTRRALFLAIDREEIMRTLFSSSYRLADAPMARTALGHRAQDPQAYRFDPEAAEELFAQAGWSRGPDGVLQREGKRLSLTVNEALPQPRSREVITKVQEQLARVGVELHLNPGDNATQNADSLDINKIQVRHTMVGRADPEVIKSLYFSTTRNQLLNYDSATDSLGDPELEKLLDAVSADPHHAAERAGDVQDYLTAHAYVLPLFEEPVVYGVAPYIRGFAAESIGRPSFYGVHIDHGADQDRQRGKAGN